MKHYGDITKISGYDLPIVDIVTGGSPCQDLSVAGKRAGLSGERSGLFMEQIRIIKEMRENDRANGRTNEHIRPRYMVWENVPGAFSSNGGKDFHAVLEETAKVAEGDACIPGFEGKLPSAGCIMGNGWSIAWRVHDAQFWGVPQRRKRISLVADFGGSTAPEILFERKGLSGDIAQGGKEGEGTSGNAERCAGETGKCLNGWDVQSKNGGSPACSQGGMAVVQGADVYNGEITGEKAATLTAACGGTNTSGAKVIISEKKVSGFDAYNQSSTGDVAMTLRNKAAASDHIPVVCIENHPADSRVKISEDGKVQALTSRMGTGGGNVPMVIETYQKTGSSWNGSQVSPTLTANNASGSQRMPDKENFNAVLSYGLDRASFNQGMNAQYDFAVDEEKIGTQVAKGHGAVASFYPQMKAESQCWREDDVSNTLVNGTNPGFQNGICTPVVRRLTPLECERLQGFPNGWTDIGDWVDSKGKTHKGDSDSPRYKALGNSIALPFWQWMAERMVKYLIKDGYDAPTMASLFDGIGGFPLIYSRCGCKPIWASEIEEFPIAVTKIRFQEENDA